MKVNRNPPYPGRFFLMDAVRDKREGKNPNPAMLSQHKSVRQISSRLSWLVFLIFCSSYAANSVGMIDSID